MLRETSVARISFRSTSVAPEVAAGAGMAGATDKRPAASANFIRLRNNPPRIALAFRLNEQRTIARSHDSGNAHSFMALARWRERGFALCGGHADREERPQAG